MARARVGWEILPGSLWVRGIPEARHVEEVDVVVSCLRHPDLELAATMPGAYLSYPMSDGKRLPAGLPAIVDDLAGHVREGRKVVIHCRAGRNRSALLAALVVREVNGCSGAEARRLVQERRPNSLYNEWFAAYLDTLPAPAETAKMTDTTTEVADMSEPQDNLDEVLQLGLVDDGEGIPQLTTQDPEEREDGSSNGEQMEMQPAEADGRTWNGAEQLRPYLCRIEELKPTPGNPDKGKAHVGQLMGSLARFGQTRAILIDAADGVTIRAGHHLTRAATELGWTHVAAIQAEFSDEGEAIAYLMADNRLARIGDEDVSQEQQLNLIDLIGEENLKGTGWDLDAVETLRSEAGATPVIADTEPWGGAAAETAEEASARAAALSGYEPHKEIPLYMTLPQHELFSEHVRLLQQAWGLKGVMDTILRALQECYDREAAPVGGAADAGEGAAPESTMPGEEGAAPTSEIVTDPETGEQGIVRDSVLIDRPLSDEGPEDDIPL